jgi:hypothetical protein
MQSNQKRVDLNTYMQIEKAVYKIRANVNRMGAINKER